MTLLAPDSTTTSGHKGPLDIMLMPLCVLCEQAKDILVAVELLRRRPDIGFAQLVGNNALLRNEVAAWIEAAATIMSWPEFKGQLTINVAWEYLEKEGFYSFIRTVLDLTGLPANRLVLELLETGSPGGALHDPVILENLKLLRELGITFALDDVGTGCYPAPVDLDRILGRLHEVQIPVAKVKLAREIMDQDGEMRALIALACRFGIAEFVFEGIEEGELGKRRRARVAQIVTDLNLDPTHITLQGFGIGHKLEPDDFWQTWLSPESRTAENLVPAA